MVTSWGNRLTAIVERESARQIIACSWLRIREQRVYAPGLDFSSQEKIARYGKHTNVEEGIDILKDTFER